MKQKSLNVNIILTAVKTVVSLLFPLITFPYVSRVLSPAGIGEYNYSNSIITYFVLIAGLGINTYAIREGAKIRENKKEFGVFANEMFSLNVVSTIVSYLILFACFALFQEFRNYETSILIFSALILFKTIGVEWVFSIYEDYFYITIRSLAFQIISVVCLFIFVKSPEDLYPYVAINVLSNVGSNIFNLIYSKKYFALKLRFTKHMWKHMVPILVIFSTTLSTMIYVNSDTTMLGWMCGTEEVGYYTVAGKMYNIIKSTLNAIVPVFMARLSFQFDHNRKDYNKTFLYAFNLLTLVTIPLAVGSLFFSDTIILILSGEEYLQAASSMKLLFISIVFASLGNLYSCGGILQAGKEKWMLFATIIGASLNIVANFFFIPYMGNTGAALTTLMTEIIVFLILYICYKKFIKYSVGIKHQLYCFLGTIPFFFIRKIGDYIATNSVILQLGLILICCIIYVTILYFLKDDILLSIMQRILNKLRKKRI